MLQFLLINMFPIVLLILPLFVLMRRLAFSTPISADLANATVAIPFAVLDANELCRRESRKALTSGDDRGCSR